MPNAKIENFPLKRFAKNAGTNEITIPGTQILGNPIHKNGTLTRQDLIDLQATAIEKGYFGACINASVVQPNGSIPVKPITINEQNGMMVPLWLAVCSLYEYPLPQWDADREYFVDSIATNSSGVVYYSLVDNNINNPLTDNTKWAVFYDKNNVLLRDGTKTMLADLDANNNSVINLRAPVNNNDAARKIDIPTPNAKAYSVNTGLLDTTTSLPNFLRRNTATELIILATEKNLVMTYANATQYTMSANATFDTSLLADGLYNLMVENGTIKAVLQSLVSEVSVLPLTGVVNQYVTVVNPLVSYKWDTGTSAFVETNIVKLGEFQILAGSVVNDSVINYAFNGYYENLTAGYNFTANHNIGSIKCNIICCGSNANETQYERMNTYESDGLSINGSKWDLYKNTISVSSFGLRSGGLGYTKLIVTRAY